MMWLRISLARVQPCALFSRNPLYSFWFMRYPNQIKITLKKPDSKKKMREEENLNEEEKERASYTRVLPSRNVFDPRCTVPAVKATDICRRQRFSVKSTFFVLTLSQETWGYIFIFHHNKCWFSIIWAIENKLRWNWNKIRFSGDKFANAVSTVVAILLPYECVPPMVKKPMSLNIPYRNLTKSLDVLTRNFSKSNSPYLLFCRLDQNKMLHMPRQQCCRDVCSILLRSGRLNVSNYQLIVRISRLRMP